MTDLKIREYLIDHMWADEQQIHDAMDLAEIRGETQFFEDYLAKLGILTAKQFEAVSPYRNIARTIGNYTIDDVVGTGAMGIVYLAHNYTEQQIALKVINAKHCDNKDFISRFNREVKAVSELEHVNIIKAIDTGNIGEDLYLATEYVNGPSLQDMLDDFGPLPEKYVLTMVKQITNGLKYAYESYNLVHRDLKPANILIDHGEHTSKRHIKPLIDSDIPKIIDFGLAKQTDDTQHLTMTGFTLGTPYYMSPEQIRGESEVDCRNDIYSLGATMYQLLTGELPFTGNSSGAVMLAHMMDPIPNPADLLPSLKDETIQIITTCLAKVNDDRFANYDAFIQAIDAAIAACEEKSNTMSILRKPLKLKTTSIKKDATPLSNRIIKDDKKTFGEGTTVITNDEETKETERVDKQIKAVSEQALREKIKRKEQAKKKNVKTYSPGASSILQVITKKLYKKETSAAFEENNDQEAISNKAIWVTLAASLAFMFSGIAYRIIV